MSIWYQQPDSFTTSPGTSRRWGFSAIPNFTRSPFSSDEDGTSARSANAMYGLMPDYARPYGGEEAGQILSRTISRPGTSGGGNPFAGMEFTECT
jgi:hypothetical protein